MEDKLTTTTNGGQALAQIDTTALNSLILKGDLGGLTETQRVQYYHAICSRLGLDPVTQPFQFVKFNGMLRLYCDKGGTQQLVKNYNISFKVTARETIGTIRNVYIHAWMPNGRETDEIGSVNLQGLQGAELANGYMKADTKAKRRATLSILGLGMLDESELDGVTGSSKPGRKEVDADTFIKGSQNATEPQGEVQDAEEIQMITPNQLKRLHIVGGEVYGKEWDAERHKLLEKKGKGSSKELSTDEAEKFIVWLESKRPIENPDSEPEESPAENPVWHFAEFERIGAIADDVDRRKELVNYKKNYRAILYSVGDQDLFDKYIELCTSNKVKPE